MRRNCAKALQLLYLYSYQKYVYFLVYASVKFTLMKQKEKTMETDRLYRWWYSRKVVNDFDAVVRVQRIELCSRPWEGRILTTIRYPLVEIHFMASF